MYMYILECADGSYYAGVTNNVEERFSQHQIGNDPKGYTYSRRPVKLVYHQGFQQANDAIVFEKKVKGWTVAKKKALIAGDFEALKKLSKKEFK